MRSFFGAKKFPEWGQDAFHHWDAPRLANQLVSGGDRHIPYVCVMLWKPKDSLYFSDPHVVLSSVHQNDKLVFVSPLLERIPLPSDTAHRLIP